MWSGSALASGPWVWVFLSTADGPVSRSLGESVQEILETLRFIELKYVVATPLEIPEEWKVGFDTVADKE